MRNIQIDLTMNRKGIIHFHICIGQERSTMDLPQQVALLGRTRKTCCCTYLNEAEICSYSRLVCDSYPVHHIWTSDVPKARRRLRTSRVDPFQPSPGPTNPAARCSGWSVRSNTPRKVLRAGVSSSVRCSTARSFFVGYGRHRSARPLRERLGGKTDAEKKTRRRKTKKEKNNSNTYCRRSNATVGGCTFLTKTFLGDAQDGGWVILGIGTIFT